jgi:predicted  nucleic acid-binding Zn-ribbon protein
MKNNILLKPLILSVLVLSSFSLLIYLIVGSPEASLWSSLGTILVGIFRTIQWLLAMTLALAVCLAFLCAVFFGAVALFDRKVAAKMFQGLQESLPDWVPSLPEGCCTSCASPAQSEDAELAAQEREIIAQERYETLHGEINGVQDHLHTTRDILSNTIDQLTARIEKLEDMTADMVSQQQLNDVSHKVQDAVDSLGGIQSAVSAMQNSIDHTASQVQDISPESVLKDLPQRVQTLEEQQNNAERPEPVDITPLQNDIKAMQKELNQVKERANKALQAATEQAATEQAVTPDAQEQPVAQEQAAQESTPQEAPSPQQEQEGQEESEHRIFSYFDDPADKEKLAELVASTLDKDMSYKQILNFLAKKFGKEKGKIISSHPSLTKEYIRQCRKNHS